MKFWNVWFQGETTNLFISGIFAGNAYHYGATAVGWPDGMDAALSDSDLRIESIGVPFFFWKNSSRLLKKNMTDPWEWYIYLHEWLIFDGQFVGKIYRSSHGSEKSSVVGRSSSKWPRAVQDLLQIASAFQGGKLHLNCFKHVWCFEVNGGPVSYDDDGDDDDDDDDDDDHRGGGGGGGGDDAINFALTHFQPCQHVKGNPSTSHVAFTFLKRPWPHPTTSLSSYSIHLVGFRFPTLVSHQRRCRIWRWVVVSIEPQTAMSYTHTHIYIYRYYMCI